MIANQNANALGQLSRTYNDTPYTWNPIVAASGSDTAFTASTAFVASLFAATNKRVTGLNVLIGATGGTDKWQVALYDSSGALVASSATAGVTVGTAANSQQIAFTAPALLIGPGHYFAYIISNGVTATCRTLPAFCGISGVQCGTATGTFGTAPATITVPVGFTATTAFCVGLY